MRVDICRAFIHTRATSAPTSFIMSEATRRQGLNKTPTTTSAIFSTSISSASDQTKDIADTNVPARTINILCLHGKGNNGPSFQEALRPLEESLRNCKQTKQQHLSFQFEYITAPFPMEAEQQQMQWWTLPPGVRSFNAKEYQGFEQSADKVMTELLQQEQKYDFILGHSQGAILLSALLTSKAWAEKEKEMNCHLVHYGYIFNGCAWPNPFTDEMERFQYENLSTKEQQKEPQVLFVVGEKDRINPPEGAIRVRDTLLRGGMKEEMVETLTHPGGHAVPVKNIDALEKMTNWIMNVVMNE